MNASVKSLGIDRLPLEERLSLVEEIWDSIAADTAAVAMTDAQRRELERRIAEDDAHPDDIVSWDQIKASTLSRFGQ
jgi:putative addiction module component (TIGR02574 family)